MSAEAHQVRTGFGQKVVAGAGWTTMASAGRQVLQLACVGVLARLLGPPAYGLMAMANVVLGFLVNFRDLGTASAVIQRPEVSDEMLSSLFWVNCGIGVILTGFVFVSGWPLAAFFHEPRLLGLLR